MNIQVYDDLIRVAGLKELGASNARAFRDQCHAAITETHRFVEVDLSETIFLDSSGLEAILSLHKVAQRRQGMVRLLNPLPPVRQILELTRMHQVVEIVPNGQPLPAA